MLPSQAPIFCAEHVSFEHFIALCRAFLYTNATRSALCIIRNWYAIDHSNGMLRTFSHAKITFYTTHFAIFEYSGLQCRSI